MVRLTYAYLLSTQLSFLLSYSKLRNHKLLFHSCMVNPSKMDQKIKSKKNVPAAAIDEEVAEEEEPETRSREGREKMVDLLVMDDEFENLPLEHCPEDYEGGWGDELRG